MRWWMCLAMIGCGGPEEPDRRPKSGDSGVEATTPELPPNLLVLLADDLGQDVVSSYGRHPIPAPMPVVDGLAAEGVRFRNAWAYPICSPTRAAMLTGRYGRRNGIGNTINAATSSRELRTSEVLLPQVLAQAPVPYTSIAAGKWHLAGYKSHNGLDHPLVMGFAHYDGHMGNLNEGILPNPGAERGYTHYERNSDGALAWSEEYATSETVDDALDRIGVLPEPWFAYVAFNAPHVPLHTPPEALSGVSGTPATAAETYQAMVTAMDTEIGRLLDGLDPEVRARTVVVFAGDNGTPSNGTISPWRDNHSKNTPYEGGVTVPLIVTGPGVEGAGREEDALVHVLDVFATFTELAGVEGPVTDATGQEVAIDSVSLVPYLTAADAPHQREYVYTENLYPNGAPPYATEWNILRDDRWKLILGNRPTGEFYDLVGDPHPDDGNEGLNLLGEGNPDPLTAEQQAAYDRLMAEMTRFLGEVQYEPRTE